jgi:hypothetical protein
VWNEQLEKHVPDAGSRTKALEAGERIAMALWRALDGVERERLKRRKN